jgi:hypothetical protein
MTVDRDGSTWLINEREYPHHGTLADPFGFLVQYAVMALSARNSRPWKFRIDGDGIEVFVEAKRWQKVSDGDRRGLDVSAGCAIENPAISARHFGFAVSIDHLPDHANTDLAACLHRVRDSHEPSRNAWQTFRSVYWTLAAAMAIVLVLLAALGFGPGGRNCQPASRPAGQPDGRGGRGGRGAGRRPPPRRIRSPA